MLAKAVLTTASKQEACLTLSGDWKMGESLSSRDELLNVFQMPSFTALTIDGKELGTWDSSLIAFLVHLITLCDEKSIPYTKQNMPNGAISLLELAFAVPARKGSERTKSSVSFLESLGDKALTYQESFGKAFTFCAEAFSSFGRLLSGKAVMRRQDFFLLLQETGVNAFAIVSLISFMVGLILAFVGAVQLRMFGAQIYVASLVAIAMSRVMGAVMAGIIMSGRTGASYAAVLGSMQVNEEVDALETFGISAFDFLVLPRMLALGLMMPLLTVYADFMGILGGSFVGLFMLDLTPYEYFHTTLDALTMNNIIIGIVHGTVFGFIVALCGCYQGINCGRSASSVGEATTKAVVTSIVGIILATAVITVSCDLIGV